MKKLSKIFILLTGLCFSLVSHAADDLGTLGVVVKMSFSEMMAMQGKTEVTPEEFSMPGQEEQHYPVRKLPSQPFLTGLVASLNDPEGTTYKFHGESWWITGQQNVPALDMLDVSGTLYLYSVPNVSNKEEFSGGRTLPFDTFWSQFAYHPGKYAKGDVVPEGMLCTIFALKFERQNLHEGASAGSDSDGAGSESGSGSESDVLTLSPEVEQGGDQGNDAYEEY